MRLLEKFFLVFTESLHIARLNHNRTYATVHWFGGWHWNRDEVYLQFHSTNDCIMANPEHLGLLVQGVATWNEWRENHPAIAPDLTSADLSEAVLKKINLQGANLSHSNLSKANLNQANLRGATLCHANLCWANLSRVDFSYADLSHADIAGAYLYKAVFTDANLEKVDLSQTYLLESDE
jgi:Pentapeptide repeats (8 copies)